MNSIASRFRFLKRLRLLFVLCLLAAAFLAAVGLPFFLNTSEFEKLKVSFGPERTLAFEGVCEFNKDGTARLTLQDGRYVSFHFDTKVARKSLYRAERLWPLLATGPGPIQDHYIGLSYTKGSYACFLGSSRNLTSGQLLANTLGVGSWLGPEANQEDVAFTLLSQILASVSQKERKDVLAALKKSGASLILSAWVESPLAPPHHSKLETLGRQQILYPAHWKEVVRAESPDRAIEAVLVEREGPPYGDPRYPPILQSNVFLGPKGFTVENLAPYRYEDSANVCSREIARSVYIAFGAETVGMQWLDASTLQIITNEAVAQVLKRKNFDIESPTSKISIMYVKN